MNKLQRFKDLLMGIKMYSELSEVMGRGDLLNEMLNDIAVFYLGGDELTELEMIEVVAEVNERFKDVISEAVYRKEHEVGSGFLGAENGLWGFGGSTTGGTGGMLN